MPVWLTHGESLQLWLSAVLSITTSQPPARCNTQQVRFKLTLSHCSVIASVLPEVPASDFAEALAWLDTIENAAKTGVWRQTAGSPSSRAPIAKSSTMSDQQSSTITDNLHYPVAVPQRGRPQKRKQRLFDSANRLLPFEKLRPIQRDETRLCWIVGWGEGKACSPIHVCDTAIRYTHKWHSDAVQGWQGKRSTNPAVSGG